MITINFEQFNSDADFKLWLLTDEGRKVFNHVYDTVINSYGKPLRHIPVISKKWDDGSVYSIDMKNIKGFCEKAINHFEYTEEYEKCAKLLSILNS